MVGRDRGAESFLTKQQALQSERLVGEDGTGQAHGEPALRDHFPDPLGGPLLEDDGHARITTVIGLEDLSEKGAGRGADVAEAQFAVLPRGGPADAADHVVDPVEENPGLAEEHLAPGVRRMARRFRSRRMAPISASSSCTARLRAGWAMRRRRAAFEKLNSSATA